MAAGERKLKLVALLLAVVIFAQPFLGCQSVAAATVTYGSIDVGVTKGDIPCHKIGALLLAEATALINGDDISIQGKEKVDSVAHELVSGKIVNQARSGPDSSPTLSGIVYFNQGPVLPMLEPHCSGESVDRKDGSKLVGRITELNKYAVKIVPLNGAEQTIPMSAVQAIHSPKVFKFSLRVSGGQSSENQLKGDARNIFFEPTCRPLFGLHITRKRAIVYVGVALLVATAIACSVAIPLSVHHHHHNSNQDLANLIIANRQPPQTVIPSIPIITRTGIPQFPHGGRPPTTIVVVTTGISRKLPPPPRTPPPRLLIPPGSTAPPPNGPPIVP